MDSVEVEQILKKYVRTYWFYHYFFKSQEEPEYVRKYLSQPNEKPSEPER